MNFKISELEIPARCGKLVKKGIFPVLLMALIFRLILFIGIQIKNPESGFLSYDSYGYVHLAKNLVHHQIFSRVPNGVLYHDSYRTPTYPLFLAIFSNLDLAIMVQVFISVASCYLLYLLAIKLKFRAKYATLSAFLLALDIPSIVYANLAMSETLFVFLLLLTIYFLFDEKMRFASFLASGVLLGFTILCRPIAQFLPFLFLGFMSWQLKRLTLLKGIVGVGMGLGTVVFPWMMRNYLCFGVFVVSTSGPINFCSWQVANIVSINKKEPIGKVRAEFWRGVYKKAGLKNRTAYDIWVLDTAMSEAKEIILNNKWLAFKQHIRGVFNVLVKPVRRDLEVQLGNMKGFDFAQKDSSDLLHFLSVYKSSSLLVKTLIYLQFALLTLIFLGIGAGLLNSKYRAFSWPQVIFLMLLIVYFVNLNTPPVSGSRLRLPVIPFLALLSVPGLGVLSKKFKIEKQFKF